MGEHVTPTSALMFEASMPRTDKSPSSDAEGSLADCVLAQHCSEPVSHSLVVGIGVAAARRAMETMVKSLANMLSMSIDDDFLLWKATPFIQDEEVRASQNWACIVTMHYSAVRRSNQVGPSRKPRMRRWK